MSKNKKYDITALNGLKEMFDDAVEDMAREVLWQIESFYESAIERFYDDYDPLYYDRTGMSMYGSSGYPQGNELFSPQNIYKNGDMWTAGITIDPSYIPGNPYRANKGWVFERTFWKGIHGINTKQGWGAPKKKTFLRINERERYRTYKVEQMIERRRRPKRKDGTKRSDYIFKVKKHVTETHYYGDNPTESFITSSKYHVKKKMYSNNASVKIGTMSNMIPSPKALVSNDFKQLTRKKNMKRMFNDILNSKLG